MVQILKSSQNVTLVVSVIFFLYNTREFAFHMENHHEGQTALTMLDP